MGLFNRKPKDTTVYTCAVCGKTISGRDLYNVRQRNKRRDAFYARRHSPKIPRKIADAFDHRDAQYHCYECLHNRANWEADYKKCITCEAFLVNFTRMPGIPDFYCRFNHDSAVKNPANDTCSKWRLAGMFMPENFE